MKAPWKYKRSKINYIENETSRHKIEFPQQFFE